jgi:hypothetical protein
MALPYRFVEACALLPMLHVERAPPNTIYCVGPQAETLAKDVFRWRDVARVYLNDPPLALRDPRLVIGPPPVGSCSAVLLSPEVQPDPFIYALSPKGVISVSTMELNKVGPLMRHMRQLFPRSVVPWREYLLPEVLFGVLASPSGAPKRIRQPPGGAIRLSEKYIPCLFTFGADEARLVFGEQPAKKEPVSTQGTPPHG